MASSPSLPTHGQLVDGKYVLEDVLGEGGMGIVWAARHRLLGTELALKILLPEARDQETVARFHREARASVRMSSVHAARVHDVAETADGTPYMVMERLRGQDLGELLERNGPLPPLVAIDYVAQALSAIEEAHAIGLVHRDLKPSNLYLATQPSGPPIIKVLDFGIARDFHDRDDSRLTSTRAVMGSPSYMSPEQLRAARAADARSDIWSIGVCLYELVTGKLPFEEASLPDLMVAVLHATPTPPEALVPGLPSGLADVIRRCLEKDAANRFQSAAELRQALVAAKHTGPSSQRSMPALVAAGRASLPSAPSLPAVAGTNPSIGATTGPTTEAARSGRGLLAFGVAFFVMLLGATGVVLIVRAKSKPAASTTSVPIQAPASAPSPPLPPDLATAGGTAPAPPATGAPTPSAAAASATASGAASAPAAARSTAGIAGRTAPSKGDPSKGDGKRPTGATAPTLTPEAPATAAPRPPEFDPGKSF
ncbi:MAG: serine/threonine protein kinase [Deltaproteobacteria bacterium]|nr:serine/threonine protein kinase [Deltaproteobacteria bacterium]